MDFSLSLIKVQQNKKKLLKQFALIDDL